MNFQRNSTSTLGWNLQKVWLVGQSLSFPQISCWQFPAVDVASPLILKMLQNEENLKVSSTVILSSLICAFLCIQKPQQYSQRTLYFSPELWEPVCELELLEPEELPLPGLASFSTRSHSRRGSTLLTEREAGNNKINNLYSSEIK